MLLRNRAFLLLMTGEMIAGTGLWVGVIANLQFMQHLISSDFLKGLMLMIGLSAGVLLAPKAGIWIDRYDKRLILVLSSLVRCLAPICMFPALAYESIGWMVLSLIILQSASAVYLPTIQAAIPAVVQPGQLLEANGIYLNIATLSRIGGTAVGGIMVAAMDLWMLYITALIAFVLLIGLSLVNQIPGSDLATAQQPQNLRFSEVFSLIKNEPSVLVGMVNMGVLTLFLGGFNLLVLSYSEVQQDPGVMGWIYAVEGTSILFGGLLAKRWVGSRNLVLTSTLLLFVFALSHVGMSFAEQRYTVLASYGLFGLTVAFFFPMVTTIFQQQLPPDAHGRFFSFKGLLDRVMFQLALLITGACLDLFGISWYMLLLAALTALCGLYSLVFARKRSLDVRQLTKQQSATA
ncbi:MAG: MFS transporter [Brevibacillus sp.]|nr:MFS transporter [Brevibacillus sp.]